MPTLSGERYMAPRKASQRSGFSRHVPFKLPFEVGCLLEVNNHENRALEEICCLLQWLAGKKGHKIFCTILKHFNTFFSENEEEEMFLLSIGQCPRKNGLVP